MSGTGEKERILCRDCRKHVWEMERQQVEGRREEKKEGERGGRENEVVKEDNGDKKRKREREKRGEVR